MMDKPNRSYLTRRGFLKLSGQVIAAAALGSVGLLEYISFETIWFKLNRHRVQIPDLPPAFEGFTIAQLSDLHFNSWTTPQRFETVVEMVNSQAPDVLVITGDILGSRTPEYYLDEIVQKLSQLEAREGVFAVMGNHDYRRGVDLVREILNEAGIRELSNQVTAFDREGQSLHLCGVDDVIAHQNDLDAVLEQLPESACAILLAHEPDYADTTAATGRFALQLSGHSHGGQVWIPFYGPLVTPRMASKYPRGFYQVGGMTLYTNIGIGMTGTLVRFNCRPEVAIFTLTGEMSAKSQPNAGIAGEDR